MEDIVFMALPPAGEGRVEHGRGESDSYSESE